MRKLIAVTQASGVCVLIYLCFFLTRFFSNPATSTLLINKWNQLGLNCVMILARGFIVGFKKACRLRALKHTKFWNHVELKKQSYGLNGSTNKCLSCWSELISLNLFSTNFASEIIYRSTCSPQKGTWYGSSTPRWSWDLWKDSSSHQDNTLKGATICKISMNIE